MKIEKFFIFLILIAFLVSVGGVSAEDVNNTASDAVVDVDAVLTDTLYAEENNENLESVNTTTTNIEVLGDNSLDANFSCDIDEGIGSLTVNFKDNSAGNPTSWLWDFGDGNTSTEQNPTHTYTLWGSYNVSLNVSDGDVSSCMVKPCFIHVYQLNSQLVNLDFEESGTLVGWDYKKASITTNFRYAKNGMRYASLQNNGSISKFINFDIIDSLSFWYMSSNKDATISVLIDDECVSEYTIKKTGNGKWEQVFVNLTNYTGFHTLKFYQNVSSAYIDYINVGYNSVLIANFTPVSFNITPEGLMVVFCDDSSGLISNWLWDFGDGTYSTEQNPTHNFKLGNQTVKLTISNKYGSEEYSYSWNANAPYVDSTGLEYGSIQEAIDNADEGDTITITSCEYYDRYFENLVIDKSLTLDFNNCTLTGNNNIPIINAVNGANVIINNISFDSNINITTDDTSKITLRNSQINDINITLRGNVFINNNSFSNGFLIIESDAVVEYCNLTNYGIIVNDGKSKIINNILVDCDVAISQTGGDLNITCNTITDNNIAVNISGGKSNINFNEIYSNKDFGLVYSTEYIDYSNNWWGSNNPTFNSSLTTPDSYYDIYHVSDNDLISPSYLVLNISNHDMDYHYWIGGVTYYNLTIDLCHNNLGEDVSSLGSLPSKNYNFKFNNVPFDVYIEHGFKDYLFTWGNLSHMDDEILIIGNSEFISKKGYLINQMKIQFVKELITIPLEIDVDTPIITYITPSNTFEENILIEIECNDLSAIIFYTLDGTNPCNSSTRLIYTHPFLINQSTTIHATAIDSIGHYARMNYTWAGLTVDQSTNFFGIKYYDYVTTYLKNSDLVESEGIWNKYNDNNSISNQVGPLNNITKWSITDFVSSGSAVIDKEGHIYIGGDDGNLYCLNSQGLVIWKYGTYSKISSTPTIGFDGNIYFVNYYNCSVYCLSPDGQLLWKYILGDYNIESSPVFANDGTLYVLTNNDNNSMLFAFKNWELLWNCSLPTVSGSTPAIGNDGTIYLLTEKHNLIAINWDGTIKYSFCLVEDYVNVEEKYSELEENIIDYYASHVSVTIGDDGCLYVFNQPNYYYPNTKIYFTASFIRSYNPNGNINWYYQKAPRTFEPGDSIVVDGGRYPDEYLYTICSGSPTLYKGVLYIHEQSRLSAVNASNGKVLWNVSLITAPYSASSPLVSANEIIYLSHGNMVYAFNLTGEQLWSYNIPGLYGGALSLSSPVLTDDGTLIVTTNQGIYAFNDIAAEFTCRHVEGTERTIQFIDLSTKGNNTYFWSFGDGNYSQEQNPQHSYSQPGKYRVELVIEHNGINLARNTTIIVTSHDIIPPVPVTAYINNTNITGGTFSQTQIVTLNSSDDSDNFIIYYTVDGSNPLNSSTKRVYLEPIGIEISTVLNAVAVDLSNNSGEISTFNFIITDAINVNDKVNSTLIQKIQELLDNAEPNSKFVFDYNELYGANFTINKPLNIITNVNTRLIGNGIQPVFNLCENAINSTINGFTIENNNAEAILIKNTSNIGVTNCNIQADIAVNIQNSNNTLIKDTSITNSTNAIQIMSSENTTVNRVSITNSTKNGIYLKNSENTVIKNSLLESNGVDPYYSEANHILLDGNNNTEIINNTINYGYFGLYFKNTNKNTLMDNNTIYEGIGDAIYLSGRYINLNITHNTLEGCFMGINFNGYSEKVEVLNNLIQKMHSHEGEPESGQEYDLFYNFHHRSDLYGQYNNAIQVFELASNFHDEVHIENNVCILLEHRAWEARKTGTHIESGCDGYGYNLMDGSDSYHWSTNGVTHYQEGFVNLVLDRIGDSSYRLRLQNMRTGEFLSDIPAFDVIFTAGRYSQTVKFIDSEAVATFDVASSITTITAKISAEIKKSISWNIEIAEGFNSSNKKNDSGYEVGEAINNPNPVIPAINELINRYVNYIEPSGSEENNNIAPGTTPGNGTGNGTGHGNGTDGSGSGTGIGNGTGSGVGTGNGTSFNPGNTNSTGNATVSGNSSDVFNDEVSKDSSQPQGGAVGASGGSSGSDGSKAYEIKKAIDMENTSILALVVFLSAVFFFIIGWRRGGIEDDDEL
ncbi:PKD domain-containing protein [Methanobrevibacter thaueri]|uniref:PKD domain-containing protein n=1 Tax=Methanobrevibacter thaueri TaxID=190975 RepID=UPI00386777CD